MPVIESITGEGIKDFTVEINQSDKSILIPVIPGTNLNTLKPEIKMSGNASVKLTSGTWKDGQLTILTETKAKCGVLRLRTEETLC